jgi:single-strand DNA-binding protein
MLKAEIIGFLGNDAVVNQVNNKSCISFNVAHTESWTDTTGQKKEKTTWVNCNYWTDKTNVANYLKKGTQVYISGTPEARSYVNKAQETVCQLSIKVREMQLLGSSQKQNSNTDAPF